MTEIFERIGSAAKAIATKAGVHIHEIPVKFFVVCPDEKSRMIELEMLQTLDGGDGSLVIQLKAKDE